MHDATNINAKAGKGNIAQGAGIHYGCRPQGLNRGDAVSVYRLKQGMLSVCVRKGAEPEKDGCIASPQRDVDV